jgi:hypothetical protein
MRDWCALIFAMTFPTIMSWVYFVALAGNGAQGGSAVAVAYGVGKAVQFAFPAVYMWLFHRDRVRLSRPRTTGFRAALGFGLFTCGVMFTVYFSWLRDSTLFHNTPSQIWAKLRDFHLTTPLAFILMAVFISLLHALFEEYYFRWFIFNQLKCRIRLRPAILMSSVAFMAHHVIVLAVYFPGVEAFLSVVVPFSIAVAAGGAVWAWIYHRSGSLYAPWLSHMVIDLGIMVVGYDMVGRYLAW